MGISASAATHNASISRGVKYLCWSKDSITWKDNSKKTTDYNTNQSRSGILVQLKGIKKESVRSNSTRYSLLCKHTLLVGAQLGGVTLGWNTDVNDRVYIYKGGNYKVSWDV